MRLKNLSYKVQIFLASVLLIAIPSTLVSLWGMHKNMTILHKEYRTSQETLVSQASMTIDTLLADSLKIAYMPLLNSEMNKAMHTNYGSDYFSYAQDTSLFLTQFVQSNRLNQNLISCIFLNKYGYSFEYNMSSATRQKQIMKNIENWSDFARSSPNYTYFGPLQQSFAGTPRNVLPVIRILLDGTDFQEIGVCYTEINFKSVEKIIASAQNNKSSMFIYNSDGVLTHVTEDDLIDDPEAGEELISTLSNFSSTISDSGIPTTKVLRFNNRTWMVTGYCNLTTGWRLIQISDNHTITDIYKNNLFSHLLTFASCFVIGLVLAAFLSHTLTTSITRLCKEVDACEADHYVAISMYACGSNQELRKLVSSFNNLNMRLAGSLEQNYSIRLQEQQTRIQMLQFQINHHFLYNTLNVIRSLANIHNIPTIETISVCMSDLLRYNLEHFPVASLEEELMQVKRYLTIQSIRFPNKFIYDCNVPAQFFDMQIPVMILQPLVENSIEHGFATRENNCCISIICQSEGDRLHFLVADNGNGITTERLAELNRECYSSSPAVKFEKNHHSIGLRNVIQRIQSYFGEEYGLSIESVEGNGTIIDIVIPIPPEKL